MRSLWQNGASCSWAAWDAIPNYSKRACCGTCLKISTIDPAYDSKSTFVTIVDHQDTQDQTLGNTNIDLSVEAFKELAGNTAPGTIEVQYEVVAYTNCYGNKGGKPGQWSARKAQMLAKQYKDKGGGYT